MQRVLAGYRLTQAVHVAAVLGIADLLASGPQDVGALAQTAGADPKSLNRLLRYLVSEGVFDRDGAGRLGLTAVGHLLRSDVPGSFRAAAIFSPSLPVWTAWGRLADGIRTGETPFELVHGSTLFEYIEEHEEFARVFNQAMAHAPSVNRPRASVEFDYSGCRLVIDVGGGHGAELAAVLAANPALEGILFDLPKVVAGAAPVLIAAGVQDRCGIQGGNFFEAVPSGGDIYILSNVLHDWGDERARAIVVNCRSAMSQGSKLLIVENIVMEDNKPSRAKLDDMQMLVVAGGEQRTLAEYRTILESTSFTIIADSPAMIVCEAR
jgi:hypothetical protein